MGEIFDVEVALRILIARIIFNTTAAGHQVAPKILAADLRMVRIILIGAGAGADTAELVEGDDPGMAGRRRLVDPFEGIAVAVADLQGRIVEWLEAQKITIEGVFLARKCMQGDRMIVRIEIADEGRELLALRRSVGILFTQVPGDAIDVCKAGDQLTILEHPLGAERAAVQ